MESGSFIVKVTIWPVFLYRRNFDIGCSFALLRSVFCPSFMAI